MDKELKWALVKDWDTELDLNNPIIKGSGFDQFIECLDYKINQITGEING